MNRVILTGRLTRDPETRAAGNSTVCHFGVALPRKYRNRDGEDVEDVTFVDCECWAKTGETIAKYLSKGSPILVEGRLKSDSWAEQVTGKKRTKVLVAVERFEFFDAKPKAQPAGATQQGEIF